jgi:hypothetical protein
VSTECSSASEKRQCNEVNKVPASGGEVKNARTSTSTSTYVFMARCLIKRRKIFILLYFYAADKVVRSPVKDKEMY